VVEQASEYDLTIDVGDLQDAPPDAARTRAVSTLHHRQSDGRVILRTV
jgi:hypothetical protein